MRAIFLTLLLAGCCADSKSQECPAVGSTGMQDEAGTPDSVVDMSKSKPPDLSQAPPDLSMPPDLAPKGCIFDRDCGDPLVRCCEGTCRKYLDRENCGACGASCGADPASQCCGTGAAARCVGVKTNADNCGACGTVCPMVYQSFLHKLQQITCCDGQCKTLWKDPQNCGMCGRVCPACANPRYEPKCVIFSGGAIDCLC